MCTERKATGEYVLACFMFATIHDQSLLEEELQKLLFVLVVINLSAPI